MSKDIEENDAEVISQRQRNQRAAGLLEQWLVEDADANQANWPLLEQELQDSALRCREPEEA